MKFWHVLVLLAILVVAALLIATIWGGMASFYLNAVLVLLLFIVLLREASRIVARGKSHREFLNMNYGTISFYDAIDPKRRDQDEEKLPPLQVESIMKKLHE